MSHEKELKDVIEEVSQTVFHNTTNFIIDWYQDAANKSNDALTRSSLRGKANYQRVINGSGNKRVEREHYLSEHPEEAHDYEAGRFDD